ncbi:peptide-methionine (S)-S-oxide reductase MsrA [Alkalimonas collagenimarina]|uniref:Peptide methionine sulfoxide reductase MsrA n=1 Tax=Alkalimonas collagenimarina TaxID=400390 RepID=A0ABT9GUT8_9GAMM|nr:peptide-methionine (S)-S-oxide reductase MsrA [Alkalimonas collagenimarina]MDP4534791.1 peptide-methionine (S)-S-oxide reductase MsrA [Alkalimonas collagenimarina]
MKTLMALSGFLLLAILLAAVPEKNTGILSHASATSNNNELQATVQLDTIVLGSGCFWGPEKMYEALPGVTDAVSGYADGRGFEPTYRAITHPRNRNNPDNYAEVVEVTFDPAVISLTTLLHHYFESHDPTQLNRQGNDRGTQYRSTILTNSEQQFDTAMAVLNAYQPLLSEAGYGAIVTKVKPLDTFYRAEEYHQDYLAKNPNGYCPDHSTGVRFERDEEVQLATVDNSALLQGNHIVVIDSASYCPYCDQLKADVLNDYNGETPLHLRYASQLTGLELTTPTWGTPTVIFLQDGKEVYGHQGYMNAEQFYWILGQVQLGQSDAFEVAFDQGTDPRFCQQYEVFKNTPDGVFVDILSGAPLFDTRDRFDSGTGWLSFTKAVDGSVVEKPDNRYGMRRTEIRAKVSGIHLGHVFPDAPGGRDRYCINATVLNFVPRTAL